MFLHDIKDIKNGRIITKDTADDSSSEKAYDEGYKAARKGEPISSNPYQDVSKSGYGDLKESWNDGWKNGKSSVDSKSKDDGGGALPPSGGLPKISGNSPIRLDGAPDDDSKQTKDTYFSKGDSFTASADAQGLKKGESYTIVDVEVDTAHSGPWGNIVNYKVQPVAGGAAVWVGNLQLLASKVSKDSKTKDQIAELESQKEEAKKKGYGTDAYDAAIEELKKQEDSSDVLTQDPLTEKGEKIMESMKEQYGEKEGEKVFYASKNKGTISGVDSKTKDSYNVTFTYGNKTENIEVAGNNEAEATANAKSKIENGIGLSDYKITKVERSGKYFDSDEEFPNFLSEDAEPNYYNAIVAVAQKFNNPAAGRSFLQNVIEPYMASKNVSFNQEAFNNAYEEFKNATSSRAAFYKGPQH